MKHASPAPPSEPALPPPPFLTRRGEATVRFFSKFRLIFYGNWWKSTHFARTCGQFGLEEGERGHKGAAGGGREGGRGLGLGLGMVRLRKVGINNNKLRLICFMMFTLRPQSEWVSECIRECLTVSVTLCKCDCVCVCVYFCICGNTSAQCATLVN